MKWNFAVYMLLSAAILLVVLPRILQWDEIDLHFRDTYYVINSAYLVFDIVAGTMILFAFCYWWIRPLREKERLILIHVISTILSLFVFFKLILWDSRVPSNDHYLNYKNFDSFRSQRHAISFYIVLFVFLFVTGQLVLVWNGLSILWRRVNHRK